MARFDQIVGDMLDASCADVFGETVRRAGLAPGSVVCGHVSVIGFSGLKHRGHVGVALPVGTARRLHPLGEEEREGLVSDYAGEIVNLLLGRIKARFEQYGLDVQAGTPVVLRGVDLSIHACGDGRVTGCIVETTAGDVQVWIDLLTPEEIAFELVRVESEEGHPDPGETLLF